MAFKDRLSTFLAGPASQVVEAPVREIIQDALAQGTVASAQELQQLRRELGKSGERMRSLEARLDTLAEAITSLQARADASSRDAQAARQELMAAKAELAKAASASPAPKAAKPAAKAQAPTKAPAPATTKQSSEAPKKAKGKGGRKSLKELGCKVSDCEDPHRSKGFCSRHYQGWRRGRLEGFVGPEGYVQLGERGFRVAPKLQGEAVSVTGSGKRTGLKVDGKKIEITEME